MAISGICRCVFGPRFPEIQRVSPVWWPKTMVHNLGRVDFIFKDVSGTYQSKRKRATSLSPLSLFSSINALHLGKATPMLTPHFPLFFLPYAFIWMSNLFSFSLDLHVLEVSPLVIINLYFVCSAIVTFTRNSSRDWKKSTPLHTQVNCRASLSLTVPCLWFFHHRHPVRNTANARAFISGPQA